MTSVPNWAEPGCSEVAPGVHRLPLSMPQDGLVAVNVYIVEGEDGLAMIDAGWHVPGSMVALRAGLRSIGADLVDIHDVFVTHVHRDHYTMGPQLRREVGARLHLGAGEQAGLELVQQQGDNQPVTSLGVLRRAGAAALAQTVERLMIQETWDALDWETPDEWVLPGEIEIAGRPVDAVAVPGHTKGHLVFHDRIAGLLFSGDHVLPTITPSIGFELGEWNLPLGRYLESLNLLLDRPDATLLPAHGSPGGSVHTRVRELLSHHDSRLAATSSRVVFGRGTGLEVASALGWTRRNRPFDELDPFNQMIAVCETVAHLDLLVERGALDVVRGDPVDRFLPAQRAVQPPSA